jgi:alanine racemase
MSIQPKLLRPAWFEIDLDAAAENLRTVRRLVGPGRKIVAVLKADGYGFGAREMAEVFAAHGADALAFADLGDAIWMRQQGHSLPILVYPNCLPDAATEVMAHGLIPALTDLEEARAYAAAARRPGEVFVKVDTGLQRLGVPAEQAVKMIAAVAEMPRLRLGGVCTHLHAPADADPAYIDWQFGRFTKVLDGLAAAGIEVPVKLAASSPLVMQYGHTYLNAVDPGSMLYGVPRTFAAPPAVSLRPAFRALKTRLVTVKDLAPRERFVDEAPFPVPAPMRLGVIPLGTSDGLDRLHDGRVLVRGQAVPIVAGPSLEHTRVDLTAVPEAEVGDEVVVVGRQGTAEITPAAVAARHGLAPTGLAIAVRERVARVYVSGERVVAIRTRLGTTTGEPAP